MYIHIPLHIHISLDKQHPQLSDQGQCETEAAQEISSAQVSLHVWDLRLCVWLCRRIVLVDMVWYGVNCNSVWYAISGMWCMIITAGVYLGVYIQCIVGMPYH